MASQEQVEYVQVVTDEFPADGSPRVIKRMAYVDAKGAASSGIADHSITPNMLAGMKGDNVANSFPRVSDDGTEFDVVLPSAIGSVVLTANTEQIARNAIGVGTTQIASEAVSAVKNKATVKALTTLATNATLADAVQKINAIIAALQG